MTLLSLVLISTGCEEQIDSPAVNPSEGKTVEVTLDLGIADEEDGAGVTASPTSKASSNGSKAAFEVLPVSVVQTKSGTDIPDRLYNLEIWQYDGSGRQIGGKALGNVTVGSTFTASLNLATGCKLLLVARGTSADFESLSGKTLSEVQNMTVKAKESNINAIAPNATGNSLANMTYYLYLENVNITSAGKIESPAGQDVRLLLKRLATKVELNWTFASDMTQKGYTLKEVKLCQVPAHYRLIPRTEETKWGHVYPSSVAEFVDVYRPTGAELDNANGTKTIWIPANARGISSYATSPIYRNKTNANPAATYAEFVVDNSSKNERLYYRVYLGGNETNDFNLLENTNYHWTIKINHANYTSDPRIQLLDQTPVKSTNLQPTANCFMMLPGTNICFNPYKHEAGTNGWNTALTTNGTSIQTGKIIDKVEVLWQTKDAGTSGNLVMGYVIDEANHQNLVNLTNGSDINNARIHVKVPVTNGGNAVIAAYSGSTIVWSWHLWISEYVPSTLSGDILRTLFNDDLHNVYREMLTGFYTVLKDADRYLRFVFITGVTKFSQLGIFSNLNQLIDISMAPDYATVCGMTKSEIERDFQPELATLAAMNKLTYEQTVNELTKRYDGYHFSEFRTEGIFNPFSVLNALLQKRFSSYWFATGTPTMLVDMLKKTDYDLRQLDGIEVPAAALTDYRADFQNPVPIIYQSGYLTIKDYDSEFNFFRLGYPNAEVEYGWLNFITPYYTSLSEANAPFYIGKFSQELRAGDVDAFMERLRAFFADIPYELNDRTELHYQIIFYLVFKLLGQYVEAEVRSARGRADAVVKTTDYIYVFEFKLDGSVDKALQQIDDKGYLIPYTVDGRQLVKVGADFNKEDRNIGEWKTVFC